MAQTKTKPRKGKTVKPAQANGIAPPLDDVLTFAEAAAYLRVSEADLMNLIAYQALPGRQFGGQWRFLKSAIQDWLRTPPKRGSKEAVMSTAGSMKDDPFLLDELEEIYRQRREDPVENIQ